jgi:TM2 domain-containing membrane protein YozV
VEKTWRKRGENMMKEAYYKTSDSDTDIHPRATTCPEYDIEKTKRKRKIPVLAALLSIIIPGLGQIYAGDMLRGFALLAGLGLSFCLMALIIGFLTFPAIWIFAVVDAYNMVKKQNDKIGSCP